MGRRGGGGRGYRLPERTRYKKIVAGVATAAVTGERGGKWAARRGCRWYRLPNRTPCDEKAAAMATAATAEMLGG